MPLAIIYGFTNAKYICYDSAAYNVVNLLFQNKFMRFK